MATLVLQAAGSLVGSFFGPWGTAIGSALGAMAGNSIDQQLFSPSQDMEGPRLDSTPAMAAEEGAAIPRVYGTVRVSSAVIWATRFDETKKRERQGGKALGGGSTVTTYTYSANFAVGLCEGPINGIRRIWADGKEIDQTEINFRLYKGNENQNPDALIVAKQGEGNAPAYRGLAYLVFEDLDLERFGNRIPQIEVEIIRVVGDLEGKLKAISIIPGSTEHGLDPKPVRKKSGKKTLEVNRHILFGETDWQASIDELFSVAPNLQNVSLVVSWFGDDLRAGECKIRPGVVERSSASETKTWRVSGRGRSSSDVREVSRHFNDAAYGGTPTDASVVAAIEDLKQRGVSVTLNPFLLMDIPENNALPSPYNGALTQPAYPWRGRISCHPARGEVGTVERTAAARDQLEAFVGATQANAFSTDGTSVSADVSVGWDYRTFILHYAHLAMAAGGVDTFIIGSELRGLSQVRDDGDQFAFVEALISLAADVRTILGPGTKITYGADWTEYFGFQPDDGSGDVYFHLDPLWSAASIDAVGIDMYAPVSDWRGSDAFGADNPDGFAHHADYQAMKAQIEGGEGYDWYYASDADRENRVRTPISDGAYDKPWVFRFKDLTSWWANTHHDRRAGVEVQGASNWQPKSKPIYLLETGCTALRGGAVQPNVFPDAKSSENAKPKGATGALSDAEQRAFLMAHLEHWVEAKAVSGPDAPVDPDHIYAWAWDARPYPAFPISADIWGDGSNWHGGHWLNGRLGTAPLRETIRHVMADFGVANVAVGDIPNTMDGMVVGSPQDARAVIDPLVSVFDVVVRDDDGLSNPIVVEPTQNNRINLLPTEDLVVTADKPERVFVDAQRDEVPSSVLVSFRDPLYEYKRLAKTVRPLASAGEFQTQLTSPGVVRDAMAQQIAHAWATRASALASSVEFDLSLKWVGLQTGDLISFVDDTNAKLWLVERIELSDRLSVAARAYRPDSAYVFENNGFYGLDSPTLSGDFGSIPEHVFLDLPASESFEDHACFMVAAVRPSSRSTVVYASVDGEEYTLRAELPDDAVLGTLRSPLGDGSVATWDMANVLEMEVAAGEFASLTDKAALGGNNLAAIEKSGSWEIISFSLVEEIEPGVWQLSRLLRGLGGTEDLVGQEADVGAQFVLLDSAIQPAGIRANEVGREISLRVGENGRPFTDRYFETSVKTPGVRARLPLNPVHLTATRTSDAGLQIQWIRRARRGADDWTAVEIPLDEDFELYVVRVEDGSVAGQWESDTNQLSLSAAALTAAGINLANPLTIVVAQISRAVGAGIPATVSIAA